MRQILFTFVFAAALLVSACDQQTDPGSPSAPDGLPAATQLDLQTNGGASSMFGTVDAATDDRLSDRNSLSDMDATMWLRLILAANKDVSNRQKLAAEKAIAESNAKRQRILASDLAPERKAAMLQAEHEALMAQLNALFTRQQIANALALKERLDQQKRDKLSREEQLRIQRQVEIWAKQLSLGDRQKAAITDILTKQALQIQVLRQRYANDPTGLRKAMQLLQQQTDAAIYALLTDAQKVIWKRLHSNTGGRLTTSNTGG